MSRQESDSNEEFGIHNDLHEVNEEEQKVDFIEELKCKVKNYIKFLKEVLRYPEWIVVILFSLQIEGIPESLSFMIPLPSWLIVAIMLAGFIRAIHVISMYGTDQWSKFNLCWLEALFVLGLMMVIIIHQAFASGNIIAYYNYVDAAVCLASAWLVMYMGSAILLLGIEESGTDRYITILYLSILFLLSSLIGVLSVIRILVRLERITFTSILIGDVFKLKPLVPLRFTWPTCAMLLNFFIYLLFMLGSPSWGCEEQDKYNRLQP